MRRRFQSGNYHTFQPISAGQSSDLSGVNLQPCQWRAAEKAYAISVPTAERKLGTGGMRFHDGVDGVLFSLLAFSQTDHFASIALIS